MMNSQKNPIVEEHSPLPLTEIDRLRLLYIAALGGIALIAIMGQVAVQLVLRNDETNARIVNIAGRQRMLSQKLCKLAVQMTFMEQKPSVFLVKDFRTSLELWRVSHNALLYGDSVFNISSGKNSDALVAMFVRINPVFTSIDSVGKQLCIAAEDSTKRQEAQILTKMLLRYADEFLPQMNTIVFQYDEEFRTAVRRLQILEAVLFSLMLIALCLEAVFIFRPAVLHLRTSVLALERTNSELSRNNDMLLRQQSVLEEQALELEAMNIQSQEQNLDLERHKSAMQEQLSELEKMYREVRKARRVQSEFLANISHELRTPMASIIGFTEILSADYIVEEGQVFAHRVLQSANTLLVMLNDLIDFAQIEAGRFQIHRELIAIKPVLEGIVDLMKSDAEAKGLSFLMIIAPEVPQMLVLDAARIRQILFNLLSNAVKFTEKGGVEFRILYDKTTSILRFEIQDTGIGLRSGDVEQVFEPFVQQDGSVTRKYGGIGVGLALVRRIVALKGGTIALESEMGKGTTVIVELPREHTKTGNKEILVEEENI